MVKTTRVVSVTMLGTLAIGLWMIAAPSPARAAATSDQGAAILYWPKIVVDATTDTLIRLSNTSTSNIKQAHCYYISANNGQCDEIDFNVYLTKEQPLVWHAGSGLNNFPLQTPGRCHVSTFITCTAATAWVCGGEGCDVADSNAGSSIPPVPSTSASGVTFVGSLECVEFNPATGSSPALPDQGLDTNKLIGEATIETIGTLPGGPTPTIDLASYNAFGIKYVGPGTPASEGDNDLHLDGATAVNPEYASCPATLILDHLFDQPVSASNGFPGIAQNTTDLTLVPCGSDFSMQEFGMAAAQFVVFNEFEQRFSTSKLVNCFLESQISLLDSSNPLRSIFSYGVSGTLAGQTRIHSVGNMPTGHGLLGVAILRTPIGTAAYDLHQNGSLSDAPDIITMP